MKSWVHHTLVKKAPLEEDSSSRLERWICTPEGELKSFLRNRAQLKLSNSATLLIPLSNSTDIHLEKKDFVCLSQVMASSANLSLCWISHSKRSSGLDHGDTLVFPVWNFPSIPPYTLKAVKSESSHHAQRISYWVQVARSHSLSQLPSCFVTSLNITEQPKYDILDS